MNRICFAAMLTAFSVGMARAQELTTAAYDRLRDRVDVKPDELRWQKIEWQPFWDGLVAAQQKDKPIFYWIYFGDPRGGC